DVSKKRKRLIFLFFYIETSENHYCHPRVLLAGIQSLKTYLKIYDPEGTPDKSTPASRFTSLKECKAGVNDNPRRVGLSVSIYPYYTFSNSCQLVRLVAIF
ncbi:MAG: hypothetical protein WBQ38_12335, partial [Ignavibacteria bacterium]